MHVRLPEERIELWRFDSSSIPYSLSEVLATFPMLIIVVIKRPSSHEAALLCVGSPASQPMGIQNRLLLAIGTITDSNIKIIAYLMRFRSQASLISQTTIINMVSSTIGAVNAANVVSIFLQPFERRCPKRAEREFVPVSLRIFAVMVKASNKRNRPLAEADLLVPSWMNGVYFEAVCVSHDNRLPGLFGELLGDL